MLWGRWCPPFKKTIDRSINAEIQNYFFSIRAGKFLIPSPLSPSQVELVGLAGVQENEEFEFEVALPEDASLKR